MSEALCRVEGMPASGRVARQVSDKLTAEPLDADRLEAIAEEIGVDWHDLLTTEPSTAI